jgi:hypothetical protein
VLVLRIIWTQNLLVLQKLVHVVTTWLIVFRIVIVVRRYQWLADPWPRGLRRGPTATRLLVLRIRIPPGDHTFVACEWCKRSLRRADHLSRGVLPVAEPNSQFRGKYISNCSVFLFHHPN